MLVFMGLATTRKLPEITAKQPTTPILVDLFGFQKNSCKETNFDT
jgi:hypothetical protein